MNHNLKGKLIYLASPYSHKDKDVMESRFTEITRIAGYLITKHRWSLLTPITSSHEISRVCNLRGSWDYWKYVDIPQVKKCDAVLVALMDGWRESIGVTAEIRLAKRLKKTILYIDPETLEILEDWKCQKKSLKQERIKKLETS